MHRLSIWTIFATVAALILIATVGVALRLALLAGLL
ncbi:hypothetical protein J2046_000274 [Rhizobium petrolearium]|nr:hypothetical protein [Neorhizobium petrolearium]